MANTELHRGPRRGVCQTTLSNTNHQTQFVAETRIFCMVRLKCHRKQPSKDNNDDNQKLNTLRHFDTPKGRGRMILRAELCVLLTERFWETPLPPRGSVLATAMAAWRTFPREPGAEGLVLAQTCPFARWYFSRPATKAVSDVSDPQETLRAITVGVGWARRTPSRCTNRNSEAAERQIAAMFLAVARSGLG